MSTSSLIVHAGGRLVEASELSKVRVPQATETWYPIAHTRVLEEVTGRLEHSGFAITRAQHALAREGDTRYFGVLDLESRLAPGVTLTVGIRNSLDKSFPMGFCAGNRVFVCDNLAFTSELMVKRKHTRHGELRFSEAIALAVQNLKQFQENETLRIMDMQRQPLTNEAADSLLLRAYEKKIVSHRVLPAVIQEWREPTYDEFKERTKWSLLNAFTTVLGRRLESNPQGLASQTMELQGLLHQAS